MRAPTQSRRLEKFLHALGVTALILLGSTTYLRSRAITNLSDSSEVSFHRIEIAGRLMGALRDLESGERGYLLTSDPAALQPYTDSITRIDPLTNELAESVKADNSGQQAIVAQIRTAVQARAAEVNQTLDVFKTQGLNASLAMLRNRAANSSTEQARTLLTTFSQQESKERLNRIAQTNVRRRQGLLLNLGTVLLVAIVLQFLRKEVGRGFAAREQLATDLDAAHNRLEVTMMSIGDGVIACDIAGCVTLMNPTAERLTGIRLLGRLPIDNVFHAVDEITGAAIANPALQVLRTGVRLEAANHILLAKNSPQRIPIGTTTSPILDESGKVLGVVLVFRDMTEHRHIEEVLRRANEDLRRSNDDLEQFAYAASHDLQEPLRTVSLYASLLQADYGASLDADANTYIDFAVTGAERMSSLLQGLLAYSRIGGGGAPEGSASADGFTALDAAKENLSSPILENNAVIHAGPLPRVAIPQLYLVQLFQNLISNAIKYRSARPVEIQVSAEPAGSFWQFAVTDNGIGIRAEYLKQVFGIFKRLHGSEFEGTGIGLAICQKIVDRAHGKIWAESRVGEGTTFYFTLPADHAAEEPAPPKQPESVSVS